MVSIAVLTTAQTRGSHSLSAAAAAPTATTEEWMVSISFANFIHFALLVELFYEYIVVGFYPSYPTAFECVHWSICCTTYLSWLQETTCTSTVHCFNNNNYILIFTCQCACQHSELASSAMSSQPMVWVRVWVYGAVSFSRFACIILILYIVRWLLWRTENHNNEKCIMLRMTF